VRLTVSSLPKDAPYRHAVAIRLPGRIDGVGV
jgi:hypothetical protein